MNIKIMCKVCCTASVQRSNLLTRDATITKPFLCGTYFHFTQELRFTQNSYIATLLLVRYDRLFSA